MKVFGNKYEIINSRDLSNQSYENEKNSYPIFEATTSKNPSTNISILPPEIHNLISQYLFPTDLISLSKTNKYFNEVCDDNSLWENFLKEKTLEENDKNIKNKPGHAKELFKEQKNRHDKYKYVSPYDIKNLISRYYFCINPSNISLIEKEASSFLREGLFYSKGQSNDIDGYVIILLSCKYGLQALEKKLLTIEYTAQMCIVKLQILLNSEYGFQALEKKLLTLEQINQIDYKNLEALLISEYGLQVLEKKLLTFEQISQIESGKLYILLSSKYPLQILEKKILTLEQIAQIEFFKLRKFLNSEYWLQILENKFLTIDEMCDMDFEDLHDLLYPDSLQELKYKLLFRK